jgi:hypothetical protein
MGLKQLGQAAPVAQRAVHGAEQLQIALLGTAVNVALRKNVAAHHNCFRLTSGLILASPGLHAQVASYKMMSCLSDEKISSNQKYPLSDLIF